MCLLFAKPRGVEYNHDFTISAINSGLVSNRDGLGGAYRKTSTNTLILLKGFYPSTKDDFFVWLETIKPDKDDELMIHLRQGTSGGVTPSNQHPYVLGEKAYTPTHHIYPQLSLNEVVETGVFAHNGIFGMHEYNTENHNLSDTYNWGRTFFPTKDEINSLKNEGHSYLNSINSLIKSLNGERVIFMFPDRDMITIGMGQIIDKGYIFSNEGYKRYVNDRGGVNLSSEEAYIEAWEQLLSEGGDDTHTRYDTGNFNRLAAKNNSFNICNIIDNKKITKTSNIEDVEEVLETEIIISKADASKIKKVINSSFEFELELPKKTIILLPEKTSDYENSSAYKRKQKIRDMYAKKHNKSNFDVQSTVDNNLKVSSDFDLDIKITEDNRRDFIFILNKDYEKGGVMYNKGEEFIVQAHYPIPNNLKLESIDDVDSSNCLIVNQNMLKPNWQITPRKCMIDKYKDYVRLQTLYSNYISKNNLKRLTRLVESVNAQLKLPNNKNTQFNFNKGKFEGTALVEFFKNFTPNHGDIPMIKSRALVAAGSEEDYNSFRD